MSVLDSDTFRRAQVLRQLLRYLWENRHREISEYAVATEALGRRPDFDAKVDASVRVQVARLRNKLEQYYLQEGRSADLRITIPVGTHRILVEPLPKEVPRPAPPAGLSLRGQFILGAVTLVLALACLTLLAGRHTPAAPPAVTAAAVDEVPPFWREFGGGGRPVWVVLPTPAFLQWEMKNPLVVRDYRYNSFAAMSSSPLLRELIAKFGPPDLSEHYSITHDAEAAVNLAAYLSRRHVSVQGTTPGHLQQNLLEERHHIYLGNARSVARLADRTAGLNFRPDLDLGARNLHPIGGEPRVFKREFYSRRRQLVPGLIVFRAHGENNELVLLSENTKELVTFLTSAEGLNSLERSRKPGKPWGSFELVVTAEIDADRVLGVQLAAYRPLSDSSRKSDRP